MGGYGSTRWRWHEKKSTVEECLVLDIFGFTRKGLISNQNCNGTITWQELYSDASSSITFRVDNSNTHSRILRLDFMMGNQAIHQTMGIKSSLSRSRGFRWWFSCPLAVDDEYCGRLVRKLYLPPGEIYFGCRHCHNLAYRKSQEHDKSLDVYRRLSFNDFIAKIDQADPRKQVLMMKALDRYIYD
jgi:hypothetical protein